MEESPITGWWDEANFSSGVHTYKNFDFETPSKVPTGLDKAIKPHFPDILKHEVYTFPGEGKTGAALKAESKMMVQSFTKKAKLYFGTCDCYSFTPGKTFTITTSPRKDLIGTTYQLVSTEYEAADDTHLNADSGEQRFKTKFGCMPVGVPYRSENQFSKPKVSGLQSATVTGPKGDEIYVDEYGRVKVQFHWDRDGKMDEKSSCWLRVSQSWAGENWGTFFHPRIGDEVLVDFIDGDLDKPIIVGRVYNGKNRHFHDLPANKTKSGIKTHSSLKGGGDNYNEFSFEDKKGSEQIFMHAEKNFDLEVEKDETHWVGQNRTKKVDKDETFTIKNNRTGEVKKEDKLTVGDKLTIDVGKEITIKTGASSITMKSDGTIEIKGVKVTVQGTKVDVKGSAMVNVKGGVVNIN